MAVTDTLTEISSAAELTELERHYGPQYEELLYG